LSGAIPKFLQNISFLEYFNVSFNMLEGDVPTNGVFGNATQIATIGNNKLCGGISQLHLPPCLIKGRKHTKHHKFRLIAVIVGVVSFLLIFSFIITMYWMRKRNQKRSFDSPTIDQLAKVSYQDLHRGTYGFSTRNFIGSGSFGSVYKGNLVSEDNVVAIKVLNLQKKGARKSFFVECNALRNIRHRNLVKVLTCWKERYRQMVSLEMQLKWQLLETTSFVEVFHICIFHHALSRVGNTQNTISSG
jgi:hypothetical protein